MPDKRLARKIEQNCLLSKNKQLLDQAGQFDSWGLLPKSIDFFKKSLILDLSGPNTPL